MAVFALLAAVIATAAVALQGLPEPLPTFDAKRSAAVAYSTALLESEPDNATLRLTLVRLLMDLDDLAAAREALAPIEHCGEETTRRQCLLMRIEVLQKAVSASPGDDELLRQLDLALVQALELR